MEIPDTSFSFKVFVIVVVAQSVVRIIYRAITELDSSLVCITHEPRMICDH